MKNNNQPFSETRDASAGRVLTQHSRNSEFHACR